MIPTGGLRPAFLGVGLRRARRVVELVRGPVVGPAGGGGIDLRQAAHFEAHLPLGYQWRVIRIAPCSHGGIGWWD